MRFYITIAPFANIDILSIAFIILIVFLFVKIFGNSKSVTKFVCIAGIIFFAYAIYQLYK